MIQARRHRGQGQLIRITDETKAHMRYVMGALKIRQGELGRRLGLSESAVSNMIRGVQKYTTLSIFTIYNPRLTHLVEQADGGGGVLAAITDSGTNMLNPVSTPEAKEYVLGPYREKLAVGRTAEHRERHRAAMKAHWEKRRARESAVRLAQAKIGKAVIVPPPPKPQGFFKRVYNAIVTGFHAGS